MTTNRIASGDLRVAAGRRVALIGARGIGRHHARWWFLEGVEVCAVAGTSPASLEKAREGLCTLFPFTGRLYDDVGRMLAAENPDWVDVCSPPARHAEHVRLALAAGCHVLCEKPFVYAEGARRASLLATARDLVETAAKNGRCLALASQYAVAARLCFELLREHRGDLAVRSLGGELASPARGRPRDPARLWVDLAPHLLAAIQALVPGGIPDPASVDRQFDGYHAQCRLELIAGAAVRIPCDLHVYHTEGEPANVRRLTINDVTFEFLGRNDEAGIFRAVIACPWGEYLYEDMLHLLIRETVAGNPPLPAEAAWRNLELLLNLAGMP